MLPVLQLLLNNTTRNVSQSPPSFDSEHVQIARIPPHVLVSHCVNAVCRNALAKMKSLCACSDSSPRHFLLPAVRMWRVGVAER